jgi:hypothetical protein
VHARSRQWQSNGQITSANVQFRGRRVARASHACGVPVIVTKIAFILLPAGIAVSLAVAWRSSLPRKLPELPAWRRRLLFLGVLANAVSIALFLTISIGPWVISSWTPDIYNYRVILLLTVASVLLGAVGRGVPRVLVILNGIMLTFLWLSLAASSL